MRSPNWRRCSAYIDPRKTGCPICTSACRACTHLSEATGILRCLHWKEEKKGTSEIYRTIISSSITSYVNNCWLSAFNVTSWRILKDIFLDLYVWWIISIYYYIYIIKICFNSTWLSRRDLHIFLYAFSSSILVSLSLARSLFLSFFRIAK